MHTNGKDSLRLGLQGHNIRKETQMPNPNWVSMRPKARPQPNCNLRPNVIDPSHILIKIQTNMESKTPKRVIIPWKLSWNMNFRWNHFHVSPSLRPPLPISKHLFQWNHTHFSQTKLFSIKIKSFFFSHFYTIWLISQLLQLRVPLFARKWIPH